MKPRPAFLLAVLLGISFALACGAGSHHSLQSVSVSPLAAASSQAQFTATGTYDTIPTSADITGTTTWCIGSTSGLCASDVAMFAEVTAGLAQCSPGFSGTVTVLAGQAGPPPGLNQGSQLNPFGAAQLTCP
ncbi:MAG: hypothetical protein WA254_13120 [Candidatus Sulfotelmatobacter sp.]